MSLLAVQPLQKTVKFPTEAAINDYVKGHPMTLTGIDVNLYVPNIFAMLAKYFSNQEIPLDDLKKHVRIVVVKAIDEHGTPEQKKIQKLNQALQQLNSSFTEKGSPDFEFQRIELESNPPHLTATWSVCERLMGDLLDRATFSPPTDGSGKWTKNVVALGLDAPSLVRTDDQKD